MPLPVDAGSETVQRNRLIRLAAVAVALVILIAIVAVVANLRSAKATAALGEAMRDFETPIANPQQPVAPGTKTYASVEERARVTNAEFASIANRFGMTSAGRNALYLQGVTAMQMGQNGQAETLLKKSADSWNKDVAGLAKLALAGLYHNSGRDGDAIGVYNGLIDKPTTTVPKGLAQIQLAELYESTGKSDQAKKIYAQIKDKEPKSAAAEIATEKLSGTPAR